MFERLRFTRYALRFERAFRSDRWDEVKACFHPDAVYGISGSGTAYDGDVRGPDAIVARFREMLDRVDRRYDRRSPRIVGWPRVRGGELELRWSVRYVLGEQATIVTGRSTCRFRDGAIIELRDTMVADECARWVSLVAAD